MALLPAPSYAQTAGGMTAGEVASAPMSAIDWLSDSISTPTVVSPQINTENPVTQSASVADVSVAPLGSQTTDAIGLLPPSVTGFSRDLWGASRPDDLAHRILSMPLDLMPSMQSLLTRLLLAELDPPRGANTTDDRLFLARVDRLLATGALDQADALIARSGAQTPASFRRGFDTALLLGEEDIPCQRLSAAPDLSPTFPARIFCLARAGDWDAAVLSLGTGRALGYVTEADDDLLSRFLDPDVFEGDPQLTKPLHPTPLTFRMFEAIGEHIPTTGLPLAFAQADLRANIGWKARVEAGERLVRMGAVSDNQIYGLYSERKPAASGGIWDRMAAVQAMDKALQAKDRQTVSALLPDLWTRLEEAELEMPFSRIFGPELAALDLEGVAAQIAFQMGLLSDQYEEIAKKTAPDASAKSHVLRAIALGDIQLGDIKNVRPYDTASTAVLEGFANPNIPIRLQSLMDQDRLGEAILRAITLYSNGVFGDYDELSDAIAFFRHIGLENVARQAALEFLILERRG